MPDHLHAVIEGRCQNSDVLPFVRAFKQQTAFWFKRRTGRRLWQASFHDHVLRTGESTRAVVRYVLENPVRARLAASPDQYPYSGSLFYTRGELMDWAFGRNQWESV
jgi:putative transposase